jgi:hypothetical protein
MAQEEKTADPLKQNWAGGWPSRPLAQRRFGEPNLFLALIFGKFSIFFPASNAGAKAEGEMLLRMMSRAFMQMGSLYDPVPLKAISGCAEGIFKY